MRFSSRAETTLNLDSRYWEYFPEYAKYFERPLMLNKSIYGMTNSVKLVADELIICLINEAVSNM